MDSKVIFKIEKSTRFNDDNLCDEIIYTIKRLDDNEEIIFEATTTKNNLSELKTIAKIAIDSIDSE